MTPVEHQDSAVGAKVIPALVELLPAADLER